MTDGHKALSVPQPFEHGYGVRVSCFYSIVPKTFLESQLALEGLEAHCRPNGIHRASLLDGLSAVRLVGLPPSCATLAHITNLHGGPHPCLLSTPGK